MRWTLTATVRDPSMWVDAKPKSPLEEGSLRACQKKGFKTRAGASGGAVGRRFAPWDVGGRERDSHINKNVNKL